MDHIEKCLNCGCLAFLYDTETCVHEEDDPSDAVTFFTGLTRSQLSDLLPLVSVEFWPIPARGRCCADADDCERSDEAVQLVSQLMGTVLFLERNVSFPERVSLATGDCWFQKDSRFIWAVYVSFGLKMRSAHVLLDKLCTTFSLLYGELSANFSALSCQVPKLRRRLRCLLRPLLVQILGIELTPIQSTPNSSHSTLTEEAMSELRDMLASLKIRFNGLFGCILIGNKLLVSTADCPSLLSSLEAVASLSKKYLAVNTLPGNKLSGESLIADVFIRSGILAQLDSSAADDSTDRLLDSSVIHLDSSSAPPEMSYASLDSDADSTLSGCWSRDSPSQLIGSLARLAIRAQQCHHQSGPCFEGPRSSEPAARAPPRRRKRPGSSVPDMGPIMIPCSDGASLWLYRRHCVKSAPAVWLLLLLVPGPRSGSRRISISALDREGGSIISRARCLLSSRPGIVQQVVGQQTVSDATARQQGIPVVQSDLNRY